MSDSRRKPGRLVADRRTPRKPAAKAKSKPKAKTRKAKPRRSRNPIVAFLAALIGWVLRLIWRTSVAAVSVALIILMGAVFYTYTTLPELETLKDGRARGSVTIFDRDGAAFAWRGDQFGGVVNAEDVSPHLKNAVIATEDKRFYRHLGVSPRGIAGAVRINLSEGRGPLSGHGGSTITQQTAKLICLGVEYDPNVWDSERAYLADCRRSSLARKMKEAVYALAMELKYSKDDILTIYLNRAYMGAAAYGAEAASQRYFNKPATALNPAEGAMIAGLLTAPSTLAPTSNLARSQARAATVLRLMNEQGYLSDGETAFYQQNPAVLSEKEVAPDGGYFADWILQELDDKTDAADAGANTTDQNLGVLRALEQAQRDQKVNTTLDARMQRATAEAVEYIFETKVREGSKAEVAVVVMSAEGEVRAMVGGRDTDASGVFNRATQAVRQTGSAFKPFVYATALELGRSPLEIEVDEPFCMSIAGSGQWCPENYSNNYKGPVTLTDALKTSLNIPAVKVSESVGRDLVLRVARDFGIARELQDTPALALGASEATLLEMTGAYAGILNGGSSVKPYGIVNQDDRGIGERVIQPDAAAQLIWMMEKVVSEGTGRRAQLPDREAAGKTGTSQEAKDAWFIGFTADYVAGVWMGYDDNTPLQGVTGGGLPADIWREVMTRVHEGLPPRPLPMQAPVAAGFDAPAPAPQPNRGDARRDVIEGVAETVLQRLLRDILGGN
ncbi:MAG: transglycosylase domain-containing protein [Paracoccaceae bacterium]|nr:transglycosylase domain-containing protein [Paracoccaceae bacterium]